MRFKHLFVSSLRTFEFQLDCSALLPPHEITQLKPFAHLLSNHCTLVMESKSKKIDKVNVKLQFIFELMNINIKLSSSLRLFREITG